MIRAYQEADQNDLWDLKTGFERSLTTGTGNDAKATRYENKLDDAYEKRYLAWVDRCVSEDPRAVQLAERDGTVVGYVFVLPETMAHIWDGGVINELFVKPAYRGTGIGDTLMDAALDVVRDQDLPLERVLLDVDRTNTRAKAFYEAHGFEHWGEMMARDLSAPENT